MKIKLSGKRLYSSNSIKYLGINIDRFLHCYDQVNIIPVKLNKSNTLLLRIKNYVNMKRLRNIYFAIFDSHLSYSCIVWAQNVKTVRRLTILQKKTLQIMNFKDRLFHSSPFFSSNNILKVGGKITLENILFVSKSINRQVPSIFYDWFTFSGNLLVFSIRASAIHSWNYTQDMLKINLSLKNATPKSIKYFLNKYFIQSY